MGFINLRTTKCIITGRPAEYFAGHVLAHVHLGPLGHCEPTIIPTPVTAGWADIPTMNAHTPKDYYGCYGEWKPEYGIEVDTDND